MSYSFSGKAHGGVITEWNETPQADYGEAQSKDDLDVAHELAARMVATIHGNCTISGGGHANPFREPQVPWGADSMSISVWRESAPVRPPEPAVEPEPVVTEPVAAVALEPDVEPDVEPEPAPAKKAAPKKARAKKRA